MERIIYSDECPNCGETISFPISRRQCGLTRFLDCPWCEYELSMEIPLEFWSERVPLEFAPVEGGVR